MKRGVIIVAAGIMQIPAIKTARDLGLFVIATDKDPDAPGFKYADVPVAMDIKDVEGHVAFARKNRERFNIRGAFAGADVAVTVAAITEALGLPGIPIEVARRSNNKWLMKQRWLKDGIATPYAEEVSSISEAKKVLEKTGFPAMIKAVDNAASRGTRKIESMAELEPALAEARMYSSTDTALVEEYVEGEEQSVEFIVFKGRHYRLGMVDRHFGFQPFPIEIGHTNPSALPAKIQESLFQLTRDAAVSLGIEFGPYKSDTILTPKGPMIFELPARLSGGFHSQYTTPIATGMDPIRAALGLAVGDGLNEKLVTPTVDKVVVCNAVFPEPGRVRKIEGLSEALSLTGVEHIFMLVGPGDIIKPYKNCANRVCYLIASGNDAGEANRNWDMAASTLKIITEKA